MDFVTLIGLTAGSLTTVAFVPQVLKTWKSKSTKDISQGMFITFCTGVFLWITYGFLIHDIPVILTNIVTGLLASTILWFKLRYR
ncbi:SemiSWEET transporter [Spirulina sp. 06S082]|uniref:SemiSWEET transporter n=1 Tax=Spirulina sp. 06S082 TaxID=3110248 RepID=UPI002B1F087C|nr:SemiSWEET transporter [Spirulina sp. 06S082]MEA5470930.1 SemiSWEET transporter [Spirulina sp. 06S082]